MNFLDKLQKIIIKKPMPLIIGGKPTIKEECTKRESEYIEKVKKESEKQAVTTKSELKIAQSSGNSIKEECTKRESEYIEKAKKESEKQAVITKSELKIAQIIPKEIRKQSEIIKQVEPKKSENIVKVLMPSIIKKSVGVLIGTFQPLHNGYFEIIKKGLTNEDIFIVCLGAANIINQKNPFYWQIRKLFIVNSIKKENPNLIKNLIILPLNDVANHSKEEGWKIWCNNLEVSIIQTLIKSENIFNLEKKNIEDYFNISLYISKKENLGSDLYREIENKSFIKTIKMIESYMPNINTTAIRKIITNSTNNECLDKDLSRYLPLPVVEIIITLKNKIN